MSEAPQAQTVVTSENRAEFMAQRMGMKTPESKPVSDDVKPETANEVIDGEAKEVAELESSEDTHDTESHENKKPQSKLEKRFSELTRQREDARQEAAKAREAHAALEKRLAELENKGQPQAVSVSEVDGKPLPSQFTDAFEYAEKLAEWSANQAYLRRDKEEQEKSAKSQQDKVINTWNSRIKDVKVELPDFTEVVASSDVQVSDQVKDAILESDVGPRVLYHLASNPEDAAQLNSMSVASALRFIGKLEARYEKTAEKTDEVKEKAKAAPSSAPAPLKTIKGASVPSDPVGADGVYSGDYAQYKALRKAGKIK
jgi:hypothetical protein